MACDELWRASPDFVTKLIEGKWKDINWHDGVLRVIRLERCKSSAPAAITDPARQWLCTRTDKVITYADRGLAILGYDRNSAFLTAVSETLEIAETTPGSATTTSNCQLHAVRQITERFEAASARYRTFLGASSCVPFPSFTDETDKTASMQTEAVAARQLLTVIGRVAPDALHSGSGARAGGGKAVGDGDVGGGSDDGDVGSSGGDSKAAKKNAAERSRRSAAAATADANAPRHTPRPGTSRTTSSPRATSSRSPGPRATPSPSASGRSTPAGSRRTSPTSASRTLTRSACRSSSGTQCRRTSATTTTSWPTPTASARARRMMATTPSRPRRTSRRTGSTETSSTRGSADWGPLGASCS